MSMKTTFLEIPTYGPNAEVEYDYTSPHMVTLEEAGSLRVVLGSPDDNAAPDVLIERTEEL